MLILEVILDSVVTKTPSQVTTKVNDKLVHNFQIFLKPKLTLSNSW